MPERPALLSIVDAVVIAGNNISHKEYALAAAEAGKHVLCEKPLATNSSDAQAMIDAANSAGVVLMTAFPCPFAPAFNRLVELARSGSMGKILAVCATNHGTCPMGWFVDSARSGGGAIMDHTVHVADLLNRLIGASPIVVSVQASSAMHNLSCEDIAMLTLDYGDGVFATLDASWSRIDGYKTWGDVTLKVVFEAGVIEVDLFRQGLDSYHNDGKSHQMVSYASNLDALMFAEFVSAIREKREPLTSGEDGLAAVKIVEQAYTSLQVSA
jgi:predicted dehydrogenase